MKMFSKTNGKGYVILNILRVLNIISLITVVIASWVMLVRTVQTSNFFFFDGVSHFITSVIGIFLTVSELSLFKSYFARYWPLLSPESGFVFLGTSMLILGFNILGNLNKSATSEESLGLPLWRIVIASGVLSSVMGAANIIATYIFCDRKQGITGRQVRMHGAAAPKESSTKAFSFNSGSINRPSSPVLPVYNSANEDRRKSRFGLKFPIRISHISKPISNDPDQFKKFESRTSPVVPDIQRPPTALHPYHTTNGDPPYPPSSRYSVVSDMTRF